MDDGIITDIKLSEKSKKILAEVEKDVDELLKPLTDMIKPYGYKIEDVMGFGMYMYVYHKETGERIFLAELIK